MATYRELKQTAIGEQPQLEAARVALAQAQVDAEVSLAEAKSSGEAEVAARLATFEAETEDLSKANRAYAVAVYAAPGHTVVFTDVSPCTVDSSDGTIVTSSIIGNADEPAPETR